MKLKDSQKNTPFSLLKANCSEQPDGWPFSFYYARTRSGVLNLLSGTQYTKHLINELFDRILDAKIAKSEENSQTEQNVQQQERECAKASNRTETRKKNVRLHVGRSSTVPTTRPGPI